MTTAQSFTAAERRGYLGGSEFAAILHLDKYKSAVELYELKVGLTEPFAGNRHTERGNKLEAIAAKEYEELTGFDLRRRNEPYVHPDYPFIVGHIDRLVVNEDRIVEIKCPSMGAFRKYQREGLPESMVIQMQIYLGLSGRKIGTWVIFCADAWELVSFDIEFDEGLYYAAIDAGIRFWNENVLAGVPPELPNATDKPKFDIKKSEGTNPVTVRTDDKFIKAVADLVEAKAIIADAKELEDEAKRAFVDVIEGEKGVYRGGGATVHYIFSAGRKTLDKKKLAAAHPEIDMSKYETEGKPSASIRVYTGGE